MNFAQAMTFDTLSHAAYDVATSMGSATTPRGGGKQLPPDLTGRKYSAIAPHQRFGSQPRPKHSASTQVAS